MTRTKENITGAQFTAIQNIYSYYNNALFSGGLNDCLLNFSRKSKAYGFFAPKRWGKSIGDNDIHEISLNPEHLHRDPIKVVSTLVHEMCHLWQQDHGKPSPGYHNKQFAAMMKEIGLYCSHNGQPGGKETGKNMTHYIIEGGQFEELFKAMPAEFLYPFVCISEQGSAAQAKKEKKNKTKYTCGSCDSNIWGKPGLLVECTECDQMFSEN